MDINVDSSNFLKDCWNEPKFQLFQKTNPLAAKYLFKHLVDEWNKVWKGYKGYRDSLRKANQEISSWETGKIVASIPLFIFTWIQFLQNSYPTSEEVWEYVKKHPEFWTRDKV